MAKYFNAGSIWAGALGVLAYLLGGFDSILIALLILMCLDYFTGILKAIYKKELSSKIGFQGIIKKLLIITIVSVSVLCERDFGIPTVREITIMFFCVNEGISILENAVEMGVKIPEKLKEALLQIRK